MKRKMNNSEAGKLGRIKAAPTLQRQKQERIDKYNESPKRCVTCKKEMSYKKRKNKFCNNSCAAITTNKIIVKCIKCNFIIPDYIKASVRARKICKICKPYSNLAKTNLEDCKNDGTRKKLLIRKHGIRCFVCFKMMWNGKIIPIEIDHIDGDHMNNKKENLRLICPNCHAQTDTYKGKNMGKGRSFRSKYYVKQNK